MSDSTQSERPAARGSVLGRAILLLLGVLLGAVGARFVIGPGGSTAAGGLPWRGLGGDGSTVLARVGDEVVTTGELEARWTSVLDEDARRFHLARGGKANLLAEVAEEVLLAQEAQRKGYLDRPDVAAAVRAAANRTLGGHLLQAEVRAMAVPESDLRSYFEARRSEWERPARVDVSEIVVTAAVGPRDVPAGDDARTQDEARTKAQALKRLVDDGADFGELARRHSEAASAGYAGRIGWVVAGRFARPYEEAALGLQAGETSAVLETPDGFVLLRVTARDDGRPVAFEDVQEEILTRFLREDPGALTRRYRTYVEELRARHPFELEGLPEGDNQQAEDAGNDGGSIPPG